MTSSENEGTGVRSELRRDAVTNRWVIISSGRAKRPSDFKSNSSASSDRPCPFCIGNEHLCAPEIFRFPPASGDWTLRVVENLFPALRRGVPPQLPLANSPPDVIEGVGFHDVIVESPFHSVNLSDLSPPRIADVFLAYRTRIEQILAYDSFEYVQVFKNQGASAGASLSHSHSQMLALPIVPQAVSNRVESTKEFYDRTRKCCVCEIRGDDHLIDSSAHFIAVVPVAASFPFEIWIIPSEHSPHFHDIDGEKAIDLGGLLKLMLRKLAVHLNDPPFNFMIQTSPLKAIASELPHSHWYLQIVPQLSGVGGFEIGSGCYINSVIPDEAAKALREVNIDTE